MKYLLTIEANDDLIVVCRLMNMLRRKGARLVTLLMSLTPEGYELMALVETKESEAEHLFHFLRRAEGVHHVTYYRHGADGPAAFILLDNQENQPSGGERWSAALPGSKLIFSGHGKAFLEAPMSGIAHPPGALPFTRVRSTRAEAGGHGSI